MKKVLIVAFVLVLCAVPCSAWSLDVHAVICELAWDLLDDKGKELVSDIRRGAGMTDSRAAFGQSCKWPDKSRNSTHKATYEYHFLNVRIEWADSVEIDRDCAAFDCAPIAIKRYAIYVSRLTASRDRENRELALRFLGHFVGDLHQPLHSGHASDLGGNRTNVKLGWKTGRAANSNLHKVWDGELPRAAGVSSSNMGEILEEIEAQGTAWEDTDVWRWGIDSYELAKKYAYAYPSGSKIRRGGTLESDYLDAGQPVARQQVMKAAVRLAHLLNELGAGRNPYDED